MLLAFWLALHQPKTCPDYPGKRVCLARCYAEPQPNRSVCIERCKSCEKLP